MSLAIGTVALAGAPPRHRRQRVWTRQLLRNSVGLVILLLLARQLGGEAFVAGLRAVSPVGVLAALAVTAATTWCCARRWAQVQGWFGEPLRMRTAYPAYYRSQLLNVALPSGAVGDLHRAVRYGWRGVLAERAVGQAVQLVVVAVLVLPGAWRWLAMVGLVAVGVVFGAVVVLSALSTGGHLLVFLGCAWATGLPLSSLLPIGGLVLLGAAIPFNVMGWGPREGMAAWAFTLFGASAATGLSVSVTFGAVSALATLPGLLVLGRGDG